MIYVCLYYTFSAYRLYTVMPRLVKFVDQLTNWYVRMNRKRLKVRLIAGKLLIQFVRNQIGTVKNKCLNGYCCNVHEKSHPVIFRKIVDVELRAKGLFLTPPHPTPPPFFF